MNETKAPMTLALIRDIVIALLLLGVGAFMVYHYQSEAADALEAAENSTDEVTVHADTPISQRWQNGPHADTFVVKEDGTNKECVVCHAPTEFLPSMDDIPPSCYSAPGCHFEVAEMPDLTVEASWPSIQCNVCHEVDRDGAVQPQYLWLEVPAIDQYAEVASSTELCIKCHSGNELPGHKDILVGGAHYGNSCTDCHDAHDTSASCSSAGCHEKDDEFVAAHDNEHQIVDCVACHDAGGLDVEPSEDNGGVWLAFNNGMPAVSHNIKLEVDCQRCHFSDNPWDLSTEVESE
jgi:hypothetical protein